MVSKSQKDSRLISGRSKSQILNQIIVGYSPGTLVLGEFMLARLPDCMIKFDVAVLTMCSVIALMVLY